MELTALPLGPICGSCRLPAPKETFHVAQCGMCFETEDSMAVRRSEVSIPSEHRIQVEFDLSDRCVYGHFEWAS